VVRLAGGNPTQTVLFLWDVLFPAWPWVRKPVGAKTGFEFSTFAGLIRCIVPGSSLPGIPRSAAVAGSPA